MPEELKDLIEKIKRDGVQAAQAKAAAVESEAKAKAAAILTKAGKDAERIISDAKEEARRAQDSGQTALRQAARDMLIALKKEINAMLETVAANNVGATLKGEELVKIVKDLIKAQTESGRAGVVITVSKADLDMLEKALLAELSKEMKKGITLRACDDIQDGFLISYDSGKSYYDFTKDALAKYITSTLKPRLAEVLKKSV